MRPLGNLALVTGGAGFIGRHLVQALLTALAPIPCSAKAASNAARTARRMAGDTGTKPLRM